MLRYTPMLKLDKIDEPGVTGFPVPPPAAVPPVPPAPADDNLDELGYEKIPAVPGDKKEEGNKPAEKPAETPAEIKDPATGYGDEPPKIEEEPAAPAAPVVPPVLDDLDKALDGLTKDEAAKIKAFATQNKVTVEQAKAYAELRKTEMKEAEAFVAKQEKEHEQAVLRTRAGWHKELKEDPVFGGENFGKNVKGAEKVLSEFMPNMKKALTERGGMLPPYVMRDLAKLADHLYATDKLVQGDPKAPEKSAQEDDGTDFYI